MKYCPYCGASLLGGAVSFCMECGKPVPDVSQSQAVEQPVMLEPLFPDTEGRTRQGQPQTDKKRKSRVKERPPKKEKHRRERPSDHTEESDHTEDGYDGYYNDVRPMDNGHERERMDPELIKRIAMVGGGAVIIIGLAVALMLLL